MTHQHAALPSTWWSGTPLDPTAQRDRQQPEQHPGGRPLYTASVPCPLCGWTPATDQHGSPAERQRTASCPKFHREGDRTAALATIEPATSTGRPHRHGRAGRIVRNLVQLAAGFLLGAITATTWWLW